MVRLVWLADVLRAADLRVVEVPGWKERGKDMSCVDGVILHHTAGPLKGNMPSLGVLRDGIFGKRPIPGPLANLGLGRDGFFYVVAAGKANHAGTGAWKKITGNSHFIGIEAENTGLSNDPWPEIQLDAYRRGVAAILDHLKLPADRAIGHKEYALPKGRKIDPSFDMNAFRERVASIMKAKKRAMEIEATFEPWIEEGRDWDASANVDPHLPKKSPIVPEVFIGKASPAPSIDPKSLRGFDRCLYTKHLLQELGWSDAQASALVAQAMVESGPDLDSGPTSDWVLNKRVVSKGTEGAKPKAHGIMRWKGDTRIEKLNWFVKYLGVEENIWKDANDLEVQVRFVDWELRNNEKLAGDQLKIANNMMEALRAAVAYIRPDNWSNDIPESSNNWQERVTYGFQLENK